MALLREWKSLNTLIKPSLLVSGKLVLQKRWQGRALHLLLAGARSKMTRLSRSSWVMSDLLSSVELDSARGSNPVSPSSSSSSSTTPNSHRQSSCHAEDSGMAEKLTNGLFSYSCRCAWKVSVPEKGHIQFPKKFMFSSQYCWTRLSPLLSSPSLSLSHSAESVLLYWDFKK